MNPRLYLLGLAGDPPEFVTNVSSLGYFQRRRAARLLEHGARLVMLEGAHHDFSEQIDLDDTGYVAFRIGRVVLIADAGFSLVTANALALRVVQGHDSLDTILHDVPNDALDSCHQKLEASVQIARVNLDKIIQRGNAIANLAERVQSLREESERFKRAAVQRQGCGCVVG